MGATPPTRAFAAGQSAAADAPPAPQPPFGVEHERFQRDVRRYIEAELRPHAPEWERAQWFPTDVFAALARRGYLGLKYPPEYGGGAVSGDDYEVEGYLADAVLSEELARCGSGGLAAGIGAHTGIATPPAWKFGTEAQKQRYLGPATRGEKIAALAITEPDAGSDVAGIRTHAHRSDGGYVVNGAKLFITNGVRADSLVTAVNVRRGPRRHARGDSWPPNGRASTSSTPACRSTTTRAETPTRRRWPIWSGPRATLVLARSVAALTRS